MLSLPPSFVELNKYPQFINRIHKRPVDPKTGIAVNPLDPQYWCDFETASRFALLNKRDLGFVLTKDDPFFLIDVDGAFNEETKTWHPISAEIFNQFHGAAFEISQSRRGFHLVGSGICPQHSCLAEFGDMHVDFYSHSRYIAITGLSAEGLITKDFTQQLPGFIEKYFSSGKQTLKPNTTWDNPREDWQGIADDRALIERALKSKSARSIFGVKASFADLWNCNTEILTKAYPPYDPHKSQFDASDADIALAQHLAYWTGCHGERIMRLMQQSALVREKWNREGYLQNTIEVATARQERVHCEIKKPAGLTLREGNPYLSIEDQLKLFEGCVYICDSHKVLTPGGKLLTSQQFKVLYGGYVFILGVDNAKTTTDAWRAFTESQAFVTPYVDGSCFKPALASGEIINDEGERLINVWYPPVIARERGDVTPFIDHLKKLFPVDNDREIVTSYFAALTQYVGEKFRWCVLIQGMHGNGKTLFGRCVAAAIGKRYSHFPEAIEGVGEKFNAWLENKLLIVINEIYTNGNFELAEKLKKYIADDIQDIRGMQKEHASREVCCNFILTTNEKDAVKIAATDRRYATFYTPQQDLPDLKRDGMIDGYFSRLFGWLRDENGYARVTDFLKSYDIKREFNPMHAERAPITSSTAESHAIARDIVEQEVLEAIEQGTTGFRNGWVSSHALDRLLDNLKMNRRVSRHRRRDLLKSLGYEPHPHLRDGRVNNLVLPDGCKPRLYINESNTARNLANPADIARNYTESQNI